MTESEKIKREIRRSQVVQPFGVGGIYDIKGESFVGCDIEEWKDPDKHKISLPRLSSYLTNQYLLDIQYFCEAPTAPEDDDSADVGQVPYMRFPRWLFCSNKKCERMIEWRRDDETGGLPKCKNKLPGSGGNDEECGYTLAPVRLIIVCPRGHMQDVNWPGWLHSEFGGNPEQAGCRHRDHLIWTVNDGAGGSLYSVMVKCLKCKAAGSLGELTEYRKWKCRGHQPWESSGRSCEGKNDIGEKKIKAVQRGAANVYYPQVESAIDIPPYAWYSSRDIDSEHKDNAEFLDLIDKARDVPDWPSQFPDEIEDIADELGIEAGDLIAEVDRQLEKLKVLEDEKNIKTAQDLLYGEWNALLKAERSKHRKDNFIVEKVALDEVNPSGFGADEVRVESLLSRLAGVRLCERLRQVRALVGFKRLEVGSHYPLVQADIGKKKIPWRPGIEVFGEGIFIAFDQESLRAWEVEQASFISERFDGMKNKIEADASISSQWVGPELLSPSFVMLHTLSHILIRQLAFECGYGASALCERIYSCTAEDRTMSGILIYTAENDCEGSLGGLVSQGAPARLLPLMLTALDQAEWCSNDPLCRTLWQGRAGLNRGACHACSLVGETSCGFGNILLDRMLVVGDGGFLKAASSSSG